ncbi:MAG TPA: sugar phosphate isomerase/epimerase [Castellaniella sp.]|uniref:sugar phosphate isomerase/epimerase family protein n=1 Tax=Castellaniella sp. TaxID=1955812 RepID=UPI002F102925
MSRPYSLAHLTVMELTPPAMIQAAAQAGYQGCGLRLLPFSPGGTAYLMNDPALMRETLACLRDTGLCIPDVEIIRIQGPLDVRPYLPFFEAGQKLGARHILVTGEDPDLARLTDSFARLCEACQPYGLTADMEFMPWMAANCIQTTRKIIEDAGQDNGGILVDPIHFLRSASTLDDLRQLPAGMIHYAQICDAPAQGPTDTAGLVQASRHARLLPGEGDIPLKDMMRCYAPDLTISIEIPNTRRRSEAGTLAWITQCLEASKRFAGPAGPAST